MSRFLLRLLINAAALWVATRVVPGVTYSGEWIPFFGVALVFGVLNTFVGFTTKILTFPLIIVTLGLFIFVINALMLWLTSAASGALGLGFRVDGFWPGLLGRSRRESCQHGAQRDVAAAACRTASPTVVVAESRTSERDADSLENEIRKTTGSRFIVNGYKLTKRNQ